MENNVVLFAEKEKEVVSVVRDSSTFDFGDLLNQAFILAKGYSDEVVKGDVLAFDNNMHLHNISKDSKSYGMTQHSFSQLCAKLGVPVAYMKKCMSNRNKFGSNLAQYNMNTWLDTCDKDLLLRLNGDTIRGVLSTKYSICDSEKVLEAVDRVITPNEYQLKGYMLDDERLHVRLIGDRLKVAGEDLFAGLQIDSSDVGRNNLKVQFLIYKQVCTNGLVIPKFGGTIFQQKHIGITSEQFQKSLVSSLDVIPDLVARATSLVDLSKNSKVSQQEFEKILDSIKKDIALSDDSMNKVVSLFNERYSNTRWGVVNALTEVAQDFSLERRLEIEQYASLWLVA